MSAGSCGEDMYLCESEFLPVCPVQAYKLFSLLVSRLHELPRNRNCNANTSIDIGLSLSLNQIQYERAECVFFHTYFNVGVEKSWLLLYKHALNRSRYITLLAVHFGESQKIGKLDFAVFTRYINIYIQGI